MKKILAPFVLILAALTVGPVAYAALPGSAIAGNASASGSNFTQQAVTTATVLTGTANLNVSITADFSGAITLPAATTNGQTIVITDAAGVGSGGSTGSTSNLIYVLCAGSDTIVAPGLSASRTRLLLWRRYGTVTLVADGTSLWKAAEREYWHIDPRTVSGLEAWYDSRRGITLNSTTVSAWSDLSGGAVHLAQGTAGNQPVYSAMNTFNDGGGEATVRFDSSAKTMSSTATPAFASGEVTVVALYQMHFAPSGTNLNILVQSGITATAGFRFSPNVGAAIGGGTVSAANSLFMQCAGTNTAAPYFSISRRPTTTSTARAVVMASCGATVQSSRTNLGSGGNRLTASASTAVPTFTQVMTVGSDVDAGASFFVQNVMVYDAAPAMADLRDLEAALAEAFLVF